MSYSPGGLLRVSSMRLIRLSYISGIILATGLKALGVDALIIDRHPQPGDNWRLRYDCLRFHIGKGSCETPYLRKCSDTYVPEQQSSSASPLTILRSAYPKDNPLLLNRQMLADHMKNYATTFNLNILNSSTVEASSFNRSKGTWSVRIQTPYGVKTVTAKHLVQCTGIGCQKPFTPKIPGKELYKGISIHSAEYKNPKQLIDQGVKVRSPFPCSIS